MEGGQRNPKVEYDLTTVLHNMETGLGAQVDAARAEAKAQHEETKGALAKVDSKLDTKADAVWVKGIEDDVKTLADAVAAHGLTLAGISAVSRFQRWFVGGVGAAILGAIIYVLASYRG